MSDLIKRSDVIKAIDDKINGSDNRLWLREILSELPSVQPERLTDDDFETIRIHLSAYKGNLCNQHRWKEAEEYERLIDRFMAFAYAESKTGEWIIATGMMPPEFHGHHICSECGNFANMEPPFGNRENLSKFCHNCGAKMVREDGET